MAAAGAGRCDEVQLGCNHCGSRYPREGTHLSVCGNCRAVRYCSKAHQQIDWRTHKLHCAQLKEKRTARQEFTRLAGSAYAKMRRADGNVKEAKKLLLKAQSISSSTLKERGFALLMPMMLLRIRAVESEGSVSHAERHAALVELCVNAKREKMPVLINIAHMELAKFYAETGRLTQSQREFSKIDVQHLYSLSDHAAYFHAKYDSRDNAQERLRVAEEFLHKATCSKSFKRHVGKAYMLLAAALLDLLKEEEVPHKRQTLHEEARAALDQGKHAAKECGELDQLQQLHLIDMRLQCEMQNKKKFLETKAQLEKLLATGAVRARALELRIIESESESLN